MEMQIRIAPARADAHLETRPLLYTLRDALRHAPQPGRHLSGLRFFSLGFLGSSSTDLDSRVVPGCFAARCGPGDETRRGEELRCTSG